MRVLDQKIFELIHGLAGKFWLLDWLVILIAQYLGYLLFLGFIILAFFLKERWRERLYFLSLAALSLLISRGLVTEIIRFFYHRPRPFLALDFEPLIAPLTSSSFPSGHAVFFFALATVVFYLDRRSSLWFFAGALLVVLTRVFVGVHWPADVLAGALIGLVSTVVLEKIMPIVV